jgi:methionyl-tRNA formyltransferase
MGAPALVEDDFAEMLKDGGVSGSPSKLRVYFVTEDDPLYVVRFFETFFEEYPRGEFVIVGLTIQQAFNEALLATARRVFSLYGFVDFARLLGRVLNRKLRRRSIASLARRRGLDVTPTRSVNDQAFVRYVRSLQPDVVVSVAAPEIFRRELLQSARIGSVNVHSGRLPVYRGMMPTFWQMRNGEPCVTVTVHEMAEKLDAGAVLGTVECAIDSHDSLDRLMTETKEAGARLLIRVLRSLAKGTAKPMPLDMEAAAYYSFPKRADALEFRRRGHRML